MPLFHKFNSCVECLGLGLLPLSDDTYEIYLTVTTPHVRHRELEQLPGLPLGFGYRPQQLQQTKYEVLDGVGVWSAADVEWTCNEFQIGPFRYAIICHPELIDPLIGWCDYGEDVILYNGDSFRVDLSSGIFKIQ